MGKLGASTRQATKGPRQATAPKVEALPSANDVERAALALIMVSGRTYLIENLEPLDFWDPLYRFLFTELRLMWEAGEPLADPHAQVLWLKQPVARRRSREAMRETGEELAPDDVVLTIANVVSEPAIASNEAWYHRTLCEFRLRRGILRYAAWLIEADRENPREPTVVLTEATKRLDAICGRAFEVFPDKMGVAS